MPRPIPWHWGQLAAGRLCSCCQGLPLKQGVQPAGLPPWPLLLPIVPGKYFGTEGLGTELEHAQEPRVELIVLNCLGMLPQTLQVASEDTALLWYLLPSGSFWGILKALHILKTIISLYSRRTVIPAKICSHLILLPSALIYMQLS